MKSNKRLIIIAVIMGLLTVLALNYYISGRYIESSASVSPERTSVVVAKMTIPEHTRITPEMVGMLSIPSEAVHPDTLKNVNEAVGGISRVEIINGEQILSGRVATDDKRASLSYRVPETMRAISIPINEVTGISGYISPGDKVDVLIKFYIFDAAGEEKYEDTLTAYTVVQNVLVIATGEFTKEVDNEERRLVNAVTIIVTPAQAEVLAFATQEGSFHLTLRSPLDEEIEKLDYYNAKNFKTFRER